MFGSLLFWMKKRALSMTGSKNVFSWSKFTLELKLNLLCIQKLPSSVSDGSLTEFTSSNFVFLKNQCNVFTGMDGTNWFLNTVMDGSVVSTGCFFTTSVIHNPRWFIVYNLSSGDKVISSVMMSKLDRVSVLAVLAKKVCG